jgi:type VI secretion system protein ImpH
MKTRPPVADVRECPWLYELDAALRAIDAAFGRERVLDGSAVRYRGWASLAFPPAELVRCEPPSDAEPGTIAFAVPMLSLIGSTGALSQSWTTEMLRAESGPYGDTALREFVDVFNHRLVVLYSVAASAGTPWDSGGACDDTGRNALTTFLTELIGLGPLAGVPDEFFARNAAILLAPPSVSGVRAALSDYFDVPVDIEIPGAGLKPGDAGAVDFQVVVGPMPIGRYREFLPTGTAFRPLLRLVRLFVGVAPRFAVRLELDAATHRGSRLAATTTEETALDWIAWTSGGGSTREGVISAETCALTEQEDV